MAIRFLFLQSEGCNGITPRNATENMNAIIIHILVLGFLASLAGCAAMPFRSTDGHSETSPTIYSTMGGGGMMP